MSKQVSGNKLLASHRLSAGHFVIQVDQELHIACGLCQCWCRQIMSLRRSRMYRKAA